MTDIKFFDDVEVSLEDSMGNDRSVIRAARVSIGPQSNIPQKVISPLIGLTGDVRPFPARYDRGHFVRIGDVTEEELKYQEGNVGLINYLMRKRHGSPFEHNSLTFYIKAPIFVAREFMRHRIGWSYNELSGRYSELPGEFYIPKASRPLVNVGSSANPVFEAGNQLQVANVFYGLKRQYSAAWTEYQELLNSGIAREVARLVLPVGIMTQFYATCNARSLMSFLALRTNEPEATYPSNPQVEIEMVARKMEASLADLFPVTYEKWNDNGRVAP